MKKIFKHILMTNDPEKGGEEKFSQSRIYLLISFVTLIAVLVGSMWIDIQQVEIIENTTSTLLTLIMIFGGYSLTGKGMKTYEKIKSKLTQD